MPTFQLVSAQHGTIAQWENADGDTARLAVLTPFCAPLYGAYGPWGGQRYWAAYSYTWGPSYYYK